MENSTKTGKPAKHIERQCPACGSPKCAELEHYSHEEWKVVQCNNCDFVYLQNLPGYEAMVDDFAWEKTSTIETQRRIKSRPAGARLSRWSRWRLGLFGRSQDKIGKYFPEGNILDIGCGSGNFIFGEQTTPYGIEISRSLHALANKNMGEKGGYAIHAPAVEGATRFEDNFFDGVVMFSYLEHEQDPGKILKEVSRILKPGGKAYVRVPNFASINRKVMQKKWCGFRYPDHVNYFTPKSLRHMAKSTGLKFSLLDPLTVAFNDNVTALLVKN